MKIALLSPHGGVVLRKDLPGAVGGAELQLKALARILGTLGHSVDYLVQGDGGEAQQHELARIWPILPAGGWPLLKIVHPKGSRLLAWLLRERPALLVQRGASEMTFLGALCAKMAGMPFLYLTASDTDLATGREILPHPQDKVLYRAALRSGMAVAVQTERQRRLLWEHYGLRGRIMPSFLVEESIPSRSRPERGPVLWGGTLRPVKRLEWLLDLARRNPEIPFRVFGGTAASDADYGRRMIDEMALLPNVDYLGVVQPARVPALVAEASLVVNSSESEGFPNAFLEAWRQERPVLATVDPDGLLSREGLGYFAANRDDLAGLLPRIWRSELSDIPDKLKRGKQFLEEKHGPEVLERRWKELLGEILSGSKASLSPRIDPG